jgi:histidinol-phosphatase (PHP family)
LYRFTAVTRESFATTHRIAWSNWFRGPSRWACRSTASQSTRPGWSRNTYTTRYAAEAKRLQSAYADQIEILAGFEAEVIPDGRYVEVMRGLREQHGLDYLVGSVHWVDGIIIDYTRERFDQAVEAQGGLERLALRYYEIASEMVSNLRPEVVGHLDLVLDINTAGYRKGLGTPYPAPWLLEAARDLGVDVCFGDDAHRVLEVGAGILEAREYLIDHGITEVTVLVREAGGLGRRKAALQAGPD